MLNPNGTTVLFCLDAAGNYHRLDATIRPIGPRSDVMLAASGDAGHVLKNVTKIGDLPVHMYACKTPRFAVVLPHLSIRTYYMARGEGKDLCMVPYFTPENSVEFKNDWLPPEDCKLVFVYAAPHCYLVAVKLAVGEQPLTIREIPLPNLYGDGRICMGNWSPGAAATMSEVLASAVNFLATSMWNSDLSGTTKRDLLSSFMRFTVDGKQLPAITPWHQYSGVVSSAAYNWIAGLF